MFSKLEFHAPVREDVVITNDERVTSYRRPSVFSKTFTTTEVPELRYPEQPDVVRNTLTVPNARPRRWTLNAIGDEFNEFSSNMGSRNSSVIVHQVDEDFESFGFQFANQT